jgi:hypothetical protein
MQELKELNEGVIIGGGGFFLRQTLLVFQIT